MAVLVRLVSLLVMSGSLVRGLASARLWVVTCSILCWQVSCSLLDCRGRVIGRLLLGLVLTG